MTTKTTTLSGLSLAVAAAALFLGAPVANAGQTALLAAEASPNNFAFRIVFNDAPQGGTPSERRFCGMVMSASEQLDGADNVMKVTFRVGINSNIVRIAASA